MQHHHLATSTTHDPTIDTVHLGPSLVSPFSYALAIGESNMIKQAAPQHPHGLTKLQHRLLYESDSESSFDFSFSSPSSVGSASEYSDAGSRTRSSSLSRRAGPHAPSASRSESISSVLGSSVAIQRVMMATDSVPTPSRQSQRQSVRAIASAFEQVGRSANVRAPPSKIFTQLARVQEQSISSNTAAQSPKQASMLPSSRSAGSLSLLSTVTPSDGLNKMAAQPSNPTSGLPTSRSVGSLSSLSSGLTYTSDGRRSSNASGAVPARLTITKQPIKGPSSAPASSATSQPPPVSSSDAEKTHPTLQQQSHFVFPPRIPMQQQTRQPYDDESHAHARSLDNLDGKYDDYDEPAFEIIPSPSPSRKRSVPLRLSIVASDSGDVQPAPDAAPSSPSPNASANASSPPLPSPLSAVSRDSLDSNYSLDSLSGHPFSLQFVSEEDERFLRASSAASMQDLDETDEFRSPFMNQGTSSFITPPSPPVDKQVVARQQTDASAARSMLLVDAPTNKAGVSTLHRLMLSTSRPSSSSLSSTATAAPASMRVNQDTCFPLPPGTIACTRRTGTESKSAEGTRDAVGSAAVDLGNERGADQSLAIAELKRQAATLLESIRSLGNEIDESIPPTHRLPASSYRSSTSNPTHSGTAHAPAKAPFVAVDQTYSDLWSLMDSWYWSSFQLTPNHHHLSKPS